MRTTKYIILISIKIKRESKDSRENFKDFSNSPFKLSKCQEADSTFLLPTWLSDSVSSVSTFHGICFCFFIYISEFFCFFIICYVNKIFFLIRLLKKWFNESGLINWKSIFNYVRWFWRRLTYCNSDETWKFQMKFRWETIFLLLNGIKLWIKNPWDFESIQPSSFLTCYKQTTYKASDIMSISQLRSRFKRSASSKSFMLLLFSG